MKEEQVNKSPKKYGFLTKRVEEYTREDIEDLFHNGKIVSFMYLLTNGLSLLDKGILKEEEVEILLNLEYSTQKNWEECNKYKDIFKSLNEKGNRLFYYLVQYSKLEQKTIRIAIEQARTEYFQMLLNGLIASGTTDKEQIKEKLNTIDDKLKIYESLKPLTIEPLNMEEYLERHGLKIAAIVPKNKKIDTSKYFQFGIDYSKEIEEVQEEGLTIIIAIATIYKATKDWIKKNRFPHYPSSFLDAEERIKEFVKEGQRRESKRTINYVKQRITDILPPIKIKGTQINDNLYNYIINALDYENKKTRRPSREL